MKERPHLALASLPSITRCTLALLVLLPALCHASSGPAEPGAPAPAPARSGAATGSLHATLLRRNGLSALGLQVLVRDAAGIESALLTADASGSVTAANLAPGTCDILLAEGSTPLAKVEVAAGTTTNATVELQAGQTGQAAPATPSAPAPAPVKDNGFFHRLGRAYVADWAGNAPGQTTAEPRRGTPPPLFSPPYPAADWPIGGTVVIGAPDTQTYPLSQAIDGNKNINKIYGWIEVGGNGSTNNKTNAAKGIAANAPAAYDVYSNTIQLDQAALYFERTENTAQKSHFDWGYRLTLLYGTDYRFTTSHGLLSQQLLVKNAQYGFDPVMFYYDFYFPHVGQGMVLRVGRYISLPDIEAQLAPNNYTYSHSILYTYDCYTQLGANATLKLNDHWTVQAGISPGCDTMPWTTDAKLTGNFCATYTWHNGGDALNTCANSINDGKYAYNNLAAYYATWYHRIDASWHTDSEAWYQYMKQTPNMYWFNSGGLYGNTKATPYPEVNGAGVNLNFGAVCADPAASVKKQQARCFAPEWAFTNYIEHNFWNNQASFNFRNEVVDDIKGQRTGTPTIYEEHMVGFDFWAGSTITFRPELSYTRCYSKWNISCTDIASGGSVANRESVALGNGPIATGLGKTQSLTLAADLIWHF